MRKKRRKDNEKSRETDKESGKLGGVHLDFELGSRPSHVSRLEITKGDGSSQSCTLTVTTMHTHTDIRN